MSQATRGLARVAMVVAVVASAGAPLSGQPAGLTLADVVTATLHHNPTIRSSEWTVRSSEGTLLIAGAPFDPQFQTSVAGGQANPLNTLTAGPLYYQQKQTTYTTAFTKTFAWGLTVSPSFNVSNTAISLAPGLAQNASSVNLALGLPLLRDRGGAVTAAAERAAAHDYQGSMLDQRTTVAQTVVVAAEAYWAYVAAARTAEVNAAAEARAAQNVEETRVLVGAEERTKADLEQVLGELATRHSARVSADQGVIAAREQLGLAMGLGADTVLTLPLPATDFPAAAPARDSAALLALVDDATRRRPDVAALAQHKASAHLETQAARNSTLPRLDLQLAMGYSGFGTGWGVGNFVAALDRHVPGLNVTLQLSTNMSVLNSAAHGQIDQSSAVEQQEQIAEDDLRRHVRADVVVALDGLRADAEALRAASEAVTYANETLDAQRQRFKSGLATVFDVLLAEDGLTNAHVAEIGSRQSYALAIASLRYASGTLLTDERTPTVSIDALVTPP